MKKYEYTDRENNILNDPGEGYERAETNLLKDGINRTHEERFLMMTRLMKIGVMLKNAKIINKPSPNS